MDFGGVNFALRVRAYSDANENFSVIANETMRVLGEQPPGAQILVHTFYGKNAFNIPLTSSIGDQYDIDPEMCLIIPKATPTPDGTQRVDGY
jgi:hypothetical protein